MRDSIYLLVNSPIRQVFRGGHQKKHYINALMVKPVLKRLTFFLGERTNVLQVLNIWREKIWGKGGGFQPLYNKV